MIVDGKLSTSNGNIGNKEGNQCVHMLASKGRHGGLDSEMVG
jgi:hypothetical protein